MRQDFSGLESHLASRDAVIIAPASASFLGKITNGLVPDAACALVHSYLGHKKPALAVANMHRSLAEAPSIARNMAKLESSLQFLPAREEEDKLKFPDPQILANEVAHALNRNKPGRQRIILTMGTTRGYIDDVRYLSNYSSGALGSLVSEELYRLGHQVYVVSGPCNSQPRNFTALASILTNDQMEAKSLEFVAQGAKDLGIFMASVLDFAPTQRIAGKISSQQDMAAIELTPCSKILPKIPTHRKIACKLEAYMNESKALELGKAYIKAHQLELLLVNSMEEVSPKDHAGYLVSRQSTQTTRVEGKAQIARWMASYVDNSLSN